MAHAGWNSSLGESVSEAWYRPILEEFERANPALWSEFADRDPRRMIARMAALKRTRHPDDDRVIRVCGMRGANVHVEWQVGREVRNAERRASEHLARVVNLVVSGDESEAVRYICRTAGVPEPEARRKVAEFLALLNRRPR